MNLKEYQKEIKEKTDLIESIKNEFIKQCKTGITMLITKMTILN